MKPNKPARSPKVGPVRNKGPRKIKGNPVKNGEIFGNMYKKKGGK